MKIGFTGASGTGKTTLANALSKKYNLRLVTNVARTSPGAQFGMLTTNSRKSNQFIIMHTLQFWSEQNNIVSDRTVLDAYLYTIGLDIEEKKYVKNLVKNNLAQYDVIFYCPWFEWDVEDEGVRNLDSDYQIKFDNNIEDQLLENYEHGDFALYYMQNNSVEERLKEIDDSLNHLGLI